MSYSIVHRRIKLADPPNKQDLTDNLVACEDIIQIELCGRALNIDYDCRLILWREIENQLLDYQVIPAAGVLSNLQRSWYRFSDQNIRGNANHQPACCNKPPRQR